MILYEPTIPARYAAPLLDAVSNLPRRKLSPALASAGIDEAALRRSGQILTFSQFDLLLNVLSGQTGRSDLGFELGLKIKLKDHGALGALLLSSGTMGEVLQRVARFSLVVSPSFSLTYRLVTGGAQLIWRPAAYMSPLALRALEEVFAVAIHAEMREALGDRLLPYDVYLSMATPPHEARYRRLGPTRYHFGALRLPEVRFVFPADLLELPRRPSPAPIDDSLTRRLAAQQQDFRRVGRWSDWVAMVLRESEGCQPTRDELAGLLNISRATLARRLAAEGTSYRRLGIRIRHQRACELLACSSDPVSHIAYRLGYTEVANFSHAFRAVAGVCPGSYRAEHSALE